MPTHYIKESNALTRIDYGFTSAPGSLLIRLKVVASVLCCPETLNKDGISDHGPLEFTFALKSSRPVKDQSIPKHWCSHPAFAERLQVLVDEIRFDSGFGLAPLERLRIYNMCIKRAALHTRDLLHTIGSNDAEHRRLVLETMARCVWRNNVSAARKLLAASTFARDFIHISRRKVVPIDFAAFEELHVSEKLNHHKRHQHTLRAEMANASRNM